MSHPLADRKDAKRTCVFFWRLLIVDAEIEIIEGGEKPMSMGPEYRGLEDLMIAT